MSKQPNDTAAWRRELDDIVEKEVNRRLEAATNGGTDEGVIPCSPPLPKPPPWIKCSDRLPELSGELNQSDQVLFFVAKAGICESSGVRYGHLWDCRGDKEWCEEDSQEGERHSMKSVTHWMPLPEPPEEE